MVVQLLMRIRRYLQGKRGIEKAPFALPEFIAATGIARIRETYKEKEDQKTMKQKARERMQPKMAKMDIDYNVLHDAFFRYQTKPKLIGHADLYHEGKEFEISFRDKRPGVLSAELRKALGMPPSGPFPPPWLRKMQLYGPPPSYPGMKIPGLNAPIPAGAQWGMQYGGWGKAPVDERGVPLYGDMSIFNPAPPTMHDGGEQNEDKVLWGELEAVVEEPEEEILEEEEDEEDDDHKSGIQSTLPSGMDTPSQFELRKGLETPESTTTGGLDTPSNKPGELFRELRQEASSVGGDLFYLCCRGLSYRCIFVCCG
jgi:splicing factor 3B subunit 2